jgi:hypothetical protein
LPSLTGAHELSLTGKFNTMSFDALHDAGKRLDPYVLANEVRGIRVTGLIAAAQSSEIKSLIVLPNHK